MGEFTIGLCTFCLYDIAIKQRMQGMECGGLNENASHRLIYLNTQSLVGRPVWEGLGHKALYEEAYHRGKLMFKGLPSPAVCSLTPACEM